MHVNTNVNQDPKKINKHIIVADINQAIEEGAIPGGSGMWRVIDNGMMVALAQKPRGIVLSVCLFRGSSISIERGVSGDISPFFDEKYYKVVQDVDIRNVIVQLKQLIDGLFISQVKEALLAFEKLKALIPVADSLKLIAPPRTSVKVGCDPSLGIQIQCEVSPEDAKTILDFMRKL